MLLNTMSKDVVSHHLRIHCLCMYPLNRLFTALYFLCFSLIIEHKKRSPAQNERFYSLNTDVQKISPGQSDLVRPCREFEALCTTGNDEDE